MGRRLALVADVPQRPCVAWVSGHSDIRRFALAALLWLPLSFFLWFRLASPMSWPVVELARLVLLGGWASVFADVTLNGHLMEVGTRVYVEQTAADGRQGIGALVFSLNPMIYGYSLPLFFGLVMATPLRTRMRLLQVAVALTIIWMAQAFGVVSETFKLLAFSSIDAATAAFAGTGLSHAAVALCYQFGYLILPAVLPVVLWLGMNRRFIEGLVGRGREPQAVPRCPTEA